MSKITKAIVYTDTHIGAPHSTHQDARDIVNDYQQKDDSTLLLSTGDIFDIKNTKRKMLNNRMEERNTLKRLLGKYYIFGNHECMMDPDGSYFYIEDDIMWLHYHVPDWCGVFDKPCPYVKDWEDKKPGLSWLKYYAYRFKHKIINRGSKWKPSKQDVYAIVKFAKSHNCDTVIFGHTHKRYDDIHDGIRIINAGRGRSLYELNR